MLSIITSSDKVLRQGEVSFQHFPKVSAIYGRQMRRFSPFLANVRLKSSTRHFFPVTDGFHVVWQRGGRRSPVRNNYVKETENRSLLPQRSGYAESWMKTSLRSRNQLYWNVDPYVGEKMYQDPPSRVTRYCSIMQRCSTLRGETEHHKFEFKRSSEMKII